MMSGLMVAQLKPNPTGKDRSRSGSPTIGQLGAEWIDLRNVSQSPLELRGIELYHLAYHSDRQPTWELVVALVGTLPAGNTLRVHSGQVRNVSVLKPEDVRGAEYHAFTGRDAYVWNNAEGDSAGLWRPSEKVWVDSAAYDPYPPEGVVLMRSGAKLIPAAAAVFSRLV